MYLLLVLAAYTFASPQIPANPMKSASIGNAPQRLIKIPKLPSRILASKASNVPAMSKDQVNQVNRQEASSFLTVPKVNDVGRATIPEALQPKIKRKMEESEFNLAFKRMRINQERQDSPMPPVHSQIPKISVTDASNNIQIPITVE
jgi:hypothetical protein